MNKGIFCISIDTELLWGRKDLDYSKFIDKTRKERHVIRELLDLFKKYNIPVTWAIVGKMYEKGDDLWSGIDIISWIKKAKIHELGSHSYSHEDFTQISKEKANEELWKNKARSFVFPRNHIKYLELLKKNDFESYRGKDKSEFELLIPRTPPTYKPTKTMGLINIPGSMYLVSSRGLRNQIPYGTRLFKCKLGINKAIRKKEVFHLWFHPVDFADNTNKLLREFDLILEYAAQKRNKGVLEIKNMDQTVREFNLSKID